MPLNQAFSIESMVAKLTPGWLDPLLREGDSKGCMRATALDITGMSRKVYKVPDIRQGSPSGCTKPFDSQYTSSH